MNCDRGPSTWPGPWNGQKALCLCCWLRSGPPWSAVVSMLVLAVVFRAHVAWSMVMTSTTRWTMHEIDVLDSKTSLVRHYRSAGLPARAPWAPPPETGRPLRSQATRARRPLRIPNNAVPVGPSSPGSTRGVRWLIRAKQLPAEDKPYWWRQVSVIATAGLAFPVPTIIIAAKSFPTVLSSVRRKWSSSLVVIGSQVIPSLPPRR